MSDKKGSGIVGLLAIQPIVEVLLAAIELLTSEVAREIMGEAIREVVGKVATCTCKVTLTFMKASFGVGSLAGIFPMVLVGSSSRFRSSPPLTGQMPASRLYLLNHEPFLLIWLTASSF